MEFSRIKSLFDSDHQSFVIQTLINLKREDLAIFKFFFLRTSTTYIILHGGKLVSLSEEQDIL